MSAAVAAILEGMPEPRDLRMHEHDGRCVITAGPVVLFEYAAGDVVMRNIALAALRQLGFRGRAVAAVLGLTENYVATLHSAAHAGRVGGAGHAGPPGRAGEGDRGAVGAGPGVAGGRVPVTRRSGGGWAWRTPRSAAAWARAGRRGPGTRRPARRRRSPCSPSLSLNQVPAADPDPGLTGAGGARSRSRAGAWCWCRPAAWRGAAGVAAAGGGGAQVAVCGGDAAACVRRAGRRRDGPGGRGGRGRGMRRCCRRSACASRSARRPPSSSSTWPRPRPGRWPGWRRCRACGPCGLRWPDRRPHRPGGAAAAVRVRDAGRGPGDLRRVLRR